MKIEFEIKDKEHVKIIGIDNAGRRKQVGRIFTPSGTGENCLNAIQVCGFKEAFDLWGCGHYVYPKLKTMDVEYVKDKDGKKVYEYAKDIQLMYDDETEDDSFSRGVNWTEGCTGCFNKPCTCERKEKYNNPFTVKRTQDLQLLEKINGEQKKTKMRMIDTLEDGK